MDLLVVGAGPYGLAAAAAARDRGLDVTVVGRPMGFWREHMPAGMYLRSGPDWHLDPAGEHTLERYLELRGIPPADVDPLPLELFLDYAG
jgi:FAD-dependent urate hydroxylase